MRKALSLFMAFALVLTLSACGGDKAPQPSSSPAPSDDVTAGSPEPSPIPDKGTPPAETQSPEPTEEPQTTPEPTVPATAVPTPEATVQPSAAPEPTEEPAAVSCADILAQIQSQLGSELPSFMSGTADDLLALYGIDSSNVEEFSLNMPMMMVHATEIFIAKASSDNMETVKNGIALRKQNLLDQWSTYLPEQYELVENAKTVTSGDYILFVVAPSADTIVNIFTAATAV
ncbi:MAG: DUF4358 domain-containing protein [Candidatus Heteroscillospira sp.]|jgi:hypothetical protein